MFMELLLIGKFFVPPHITAVWHKEWNKNANFLLTETVPSVQSKGYSAVNYQLLDEESTGRIHHKNIIPPGITRSLTWKSTG
jgi:hypothetical protein